MSTLRSSPRAARLRHLAVAMGILTAVTGMGTAQAAGAPDPVKPPTTGAVEHTGPVPGGYASWDELLLDQQRMVRAADRITAVPDKNGYAGVVAAPEHRELRVYWKGELPARVGDLVERLRRDVAVSVLPARYSARELERAADRLMRENGDVLTSVAPLQDGSGLTASVATVGAARTAVAGAAVPVTLEHGVRPELASRWDDSPPWWGGGVWGTGGSAFCTTGFAVTYQGATRLLSGRHCANVGQTATDPTGQVIGPVTHTNNPRDLLLITTGSAGRVYNNPVGSVATEYSNPVIGTTSSLIGMFVCVSGGFSGTTCNVRVTAVNVTLNAGSGYLLQGMVRADQAAFTNAAGQGDSGAPVEVLAPSSTSQVSAAGSISAIDGGARVPCTGYVTNRLCSARVYYSPWSNATAAFPGITVVTG
ncbi:hypothetical protein ABGB17_23615 [Sphaerisporangium sp. B11E5]|uniref:hypothetical protein n=1 Tax=Sphaerisporangium sp. B11E5 TaxID=3153563 RepID=UPI00325ED6DB